jgi:cell volume regulation protein A
MPTTTPDYLLLLIGALLLLGILATKLSPHLGVPALVLFMAAGMAAGSEGAGGITFHDASLARLLGTIALIGILFSSGMSIRWDVFSPLLKPGLALAIAGPVLATIIVAAVLNLAVGLAWPVGALVGAVTAATDPIALGSLLRSPRARTDPRTVEALRFESAAGTAMAAYLALSLLRWASGETTVWWEVLIGFLTSAVVGLLVGFVLGHATVWVLNHLQPDAEVLYSLLTVAAGFLIYGIAVVLRGSGFLAVFVAAVIIGNSDLPDRGPMRRFHEGLPWLSQITLFALLGLLVPPSAFFRSVGIGLLTAAAILLLARPIGAFAFFSGRGISAAHKAFISWAGLKGAAPVALATFPLFHRLPEADWILGVVAVVVVVSAALQGLTLPWMVALFRMGSTSRLEPPEPLDMVDLGPGALACYHIDDQSRAVGRSISDLGLPENCLLILVTRHGERVRPRGSTVLKAGDEVYAYSPRELFPVLQIRLLGERD